MLPLFIGAWLTISPLSVQSDTTSVILLEFSETMSIEGLLNVSNYQITDSIKNYRIFSIGIVKSIDGIQTKDTSLIALVSGRLPYRTEFWVIVTGVKDKAGNLIGDKNKAWFYFDGFRPNRIPTPSVMLNK